MVLRWFGCDLVWFCAIDEEFWSVFEVVYFFGIKESFFGVVWGVGVLGCFEKFGLFMIRFICCIAKIFGL